MATLTVRGLEEDIVRNLRARAAENGRSAEAEHREILREALSEASRKPTRAEMAERLAAFRRETGGPAAGPAAEVLAETRGDRMRRMTGSDEGL